MLVLVREGMLACFLLVCLCVEVSFFLCMYLSYLFLILFLHIQLFAVLGDYYELTCVGLKRDALISSIGKHSIRVPDYD